MRRIPARNPSSIPGPLDLPVDPRRARRMMPSLAVAAALLAACHQPPPSPLAGSPAPAEGRAKEATPAGPDVPPPPVAATREDPVRAMLDRWLKAIETDNGPAAEAILVSEKELEPVASEGLQASFAGAILPQNREILRALLKLAREEKELNLLEWKPGKPSRSNAGSTFHTPVTLMENCRLELVIGDQSPVVILGLIELGGRWRILKLELPVSEREEG